MNGFHPLRLALAWIVLSGNAAAIPAQVKTGIDVLQERGFDLLQGKRVGLVTNPTGVDATLRSTIDILHQHVNLTALFGPEHGVRGDFSAGDHVGDMVDERTGVTVFSLYGDHRKPGAREMEMVDVIVYDVQDIGVRSYTFISTLGLVMEAAAEHDREVVVLDRPNPLGGKRIEGPVVEEGYFSFISQYPIPYIYGLTCGELALFLNGEGMLEGGRRCRLTVVEMEGWKRGMTFGDTGLEWVPTSPHIPDPVSALCNPATGIIGELDGSMIGIGYTLPFRTLVTPNIDAQRLSDSMNALRLEGVTFRPIHYRPYYGQRKGEELQGVQLHITDPAMAALTPIQFLFLQEAHRIDPAFNPFAGREERYRMFDLACGSDRFRKAMMADFDFEKIRQTWTGEPERFRSQSSKYYLYP